MKKSYKRKKGPVQSKKTTFDGIKFASGLEVYMYKALKKAKIKAKYEGKTFEIVSGFDFIHPCYERTANGRGEFKQRGGKKILPIEERDAKVAKKYLGNVRVVWSNGTFPEAPKMGAPAPALKAAAVEAKDDLPF